MPFSYLTEQKTFGGYFKKNRAVGRGRKFWRV
jgi:hypothetical protein